MRNILISGILITLACVMGGCEKDNEVGVNFTIIGNWQLKESTSGSTGEVEYFDEHVRIIKFTRNTYTIYDSGNLIRQGPYLIVREKSYIRGETENMILFGATVDTKDDFVRNILEIRDDNLKISLDANDGPSVVYKRIR